MSGERGPTTEELRARVLAAVEKTREGADAVDANAAALADLGANYAAAAARQIARRMRADAAALEAEALDERRAEHQ